MIKIGLLSDTHGFVNQRVEEFFLHCDEIWHAGDVGDIGVAETLLALKPFKAVYGNIDGAEVRAVFPEVQIFHCEEVKVLIRHIGGYPGRYDRAALDLIKAEKPGLFIAGHSHILKVIYDQNNKLLFINPGAAGNNGLHKSITMVRFCIEGSRIFDLEILDIPRSTAPAP